MDCTEEKSFWATFCTRNEPRPLTPNACSTTTSLAMSPATVSPATVVIGIIALRSTCRRTTSASGIPRLRAVSTCSRVSSSRTAVLVSCAT